MEHVLGLGVEMSLLGRWSGASRCLSLVVNSPPPGPPGVCSALPGSRAQGSRVSYGFAVSEAGNELKREKALAEFSRGKWGLTEGRLSPLGRTWTSLAHDEFDLDDTVEGNNVLRKAFRKPFVSW